MASNLLIKELIKENELNWEKRSDKRFTSNLEALYYPLYYALLEAI